MVWGRSTVPVTGNFEPCTSSGHCKKSWMAPKCYIISLQESTCASFSTKQYIIHSDLKTDTRLVLAYITITHDDIHNIHRENIFFFINNNIFLRLSLIHTKQSYFPLLNFLLWYHNRKKNTCEHARLVWPGQKQSMYTHTHTHNKSVMESLGPHLPGNDLRD